MIEVPTQTITPSGKDRLAKQWRKKNLRNNENCGGNYRKGWNEKHLSYSSRFRKQKIQASLTQVRSKRASELLFIK